MEYTARRPGKTIPDPVEYPMTSHCIFCGKAETSEEHIFPRWLMRRFRGQGTVEHQKSLHAVPRTERDNCLRVRVECACVGCNGGWMSVLQNHTKPIITQLLYKPTCELDVYNLKTLSLWAVMSTMSLEATNEPKTWQFNHYERCLLHLRKEIPPRTTVWIAKWVNSTGLSYAGRILGDNPRSPQGYESDSAAAAESGLAIISRVPWNRALVTTFGFGSLLFQVVKETPAEPTDNRTMQARPGAPREQILLAASLAPARGYPDVLASPVGR